MPFKWVILRNSYFAVFVGITSLQKKINAWLLGLLEQVIFWWMIECLFARFQYCSCWYLDDLMNSTWFISIDYVFSVQNNLHLKWNKYKNYLSLWSLDTWLRPQCELFGTFCLCVYVQRINNYKCIYLPDSVECF